ncbi:hypothetical protein SAMN04487957_104214 [Halomonas shengliensis]|uniref:Helix-turn-helix domain-containing protein n=1 Tax=Halomonas shengliensis TaxID=419597 RepID=A0A1H0HL09_9GAMM|nr:hypothetical protein [Halomonas shengliensis]SDO19896.1 hypothetical protein SAMN04487957_104214 [Halomonas shengliensis]
MPTIAPPSPRQRRLLEALARGPISREDADRIAPASNGPHHIGTLRRAYGLWLPCERVPCVTIDGEPTTRGVYRPTPADRRRIARILSAIDTEGAA